jgi:hypothetical protein
MTEFMKLKRRKKMCDEFQKLSNSLKCVLTSFSLKKVTLTEVEGSIQVGPNIRKNE